MSFTSKERSIKSSVKKQIQYFPTYYPNLILPLLTRQQSFMERML